MIAETKFKQIPEEDSFEDDGSLPPPPEVIIWKRNNDNCICFLGCFGCLVTTTCLLGLVVTIPLALFTSLFSSKSSFWFSLDNSLSTQYIQQDEEFVMVTCPIKVREAEANISWTINGMDVYNFSTSSSLNLIEESAHLIVYNYTINLESTTFSCLAVREESGESVEADVHIRIKRSPSFINEETRRKHLLLKRGEKVEIKCQVDAQPPVEFRWQCGDVDISGAIPNGKFSQYNDNNNTGSLNITYIPQMFRNNPTCVCYPYQVDVFQPEMIFQETILTEFIPSLVFRRPFIRASTARLVLQPGTRGNFTTDSKKCFFVQYKTVEVNSDRLEQGFEWKYADRFLTYVDRVEPCQLELPTGLQLQDNEEFNILDIARHLHGIQPSQFLMNGLEPYSKYQARAMYITVLEGENYPVIKKMAGLDFKTEYFVDVN